MRILLVFCLLIYSCNTKQEVKTQLVVNPSTTSKTTNKDSKTDSQRISKDFLLGRIDYDEDSLFVKVDNQWTSKPLFLRKECYTNFKLMVNAASNEDIELVIISGARNFNDQKAIWERKWKQYDTMEAKARALKILEYSSMPGTSRHHWGTDIDINNLTNSYFESGKGKKEYDWLIANANKFGFYQVYTSKENGRTGYKEEKWHWSFLPTASKYLRAYNEQVVLEDINGFDGFETETKLNVIDAYVNGISKKALHFED